MCYLLASIDWGQDHLVTHHNIVTIGAQLKQKCCKFLKTVQCFCLGGFRSKEAIDDFGSNSHLAILIQ